MDRANSGKFEVTADKGQHIVSSYNIDTCLYRMSPHISLIIAEANNDFNKLRNKMEGRANNRDQGQCVMSFRN